MRREFQDNGMQAPRPYYAISDYYRGIFGKKIYKIPLSVADTCPNRMGLKGMRTCAFCDEWGSAAYPDRAQEGVARQLELNKARVLKRVNVSDFLAYFQAYTNSFAKLAILEKQIDEALAVDGIRGVVVGTRPDCVSPAVMRLWQKTHERSWCSVELGVQSFFDHHLEFMARGHSGQASIDALKRIAENTTVDVGIHLIFGNPGETDAEIVETARLCNELPLKHVKLHHLHVLKGTELAERHARGEFHPVEFEIYAERVALFLRHLRPEIAVQRLAALSNRPQELIAPDWTAKKFQVHEGIIGHMLRAGARQGDLWRPAV
ncbi:MAG TPA: TIGR01212 family radical SAM protein [Bdellovibrionota bacterium]|jgi:radical SAM protein (TIGR01212 family)|nr:TIGR01212 family radical SAM protein [Bdellovibrionota bacterium]